MAYWNHFAERKFKKVLFKDLGIGEKFRSDFFKGNRRRRDIICIKTSDMDYIEEKSKVIHAFKLFPENIEVSSFL